MTRRFGRLIHNFYSHTLHNEMVRALLSRERLSLAAVHATPPCSQIGTPASEPQKTPQWMSSCSTQVSHITQVSDSHCTSISLLSHVSCSLQPKHHDLSCFMQSSLTCKFLFLYKSLALQSSQRTVSINSVLALHVTLNSLPAISCISGETLSIPSFSAYLHSKSAPVDGVLLSL